MKHSLNPKETNHYLLLLLLPPPIFLLSVPLFFPTYIYIYIPLSLCLSLLFTHLSLSLPSLSLDQPSLRSLSIAPPLLSRFIFPFFPLPSPLPTSFYPDVQFDRLCSFQPLPSFSLGRTPSTATPYRKPDVDASVASLPLRSATSLNSDSGLFSDRNFTGKFSLRLRDRGWGWARPNCRG